MKNQASETLSPHPMEVHQHEIEQRGVVVIDSFTDIPVHNEPFISPNLTIALCRGGVFHGEYDMLPVEFSKYDVAIVYPEHSMRVADCSDDYLATLILVSAEFYEKLRSRLVHSNSQWFHYNPHLTMDERCFDSIHHAALLLKSVSDQDFKHREETISDILDVTWNLIELLGRGENLAQKNYEYKEHAASHPLFSQFYNLLTQHYKESREVSFYARKLCLSPKYFGTIIKRDMGVSAGFCIAKYICTKAKTLLRFRPDLSIQQIGYKLGFSEPAAFTRYFKSAAGISPKEYREGVQTGKNKLVKR